MKLRGEFLCLCLIGIITFSSCQKKEIIPAPASIDRSYFPLWVGKYIIYDVDSIVYNDFNGTTDSFHYQVQEFLDTSYLDASDSLAYRIIRSKRPDPNSSWQLTDVWSENLTFNTAEKVEENLRFIKLLFPIVKNKYWPGNIKIMVDSSSVYFPDWEYKYTSVDVPLTLNGISFDSTVTVLQHDEENAIQKFYYEEKYAKHVGMIYKEEDHVETQPGEYPNGTVIRMTVSEFN